MGNIRSEQRRQKILDCAKPIFLEQGYQDTSIDQIVSAAGGSKQSIYLHFGSKQGLYEAIIHEMAKSADVGFSLEKSQYGTISSTLRDFATSYLDHVLSEDVIKLLRVIVSHSNQDKEGANIFRQFGPDEHVRQLSEYFENLNKMGQMQVPNTQLAAKQFLAMLRADMQIKALTKTNYRPTPEEIEASIDGTVNAYVKTYS